jgi:hypothetical protein
VPAIGLLVAFGPAAGASTASPANHHRFVASASVRAAARAQVEKLLQRQHGVIDIYSKGHPVAGGKNGIKPKTSVQSTNWSGYADTGTNFTKATATYLEPTFNCAKSAKGSLAAFWVGIDGFSSGSVEQDGTLVECEGNTAVQFSWWEMFPTNAVQIVGTTVASGDRIHLSVVRSGTSYKLAVTDSTDTADSFTTTQTCSSCANSSAEFIAEAPTSGGSITALTDFGTWRLEGATAATSTQSGVISSFADDEITMVTSSGAVAAQPTALDPAGNQFTVKWVS